MPSALAVFACRPNSHPFQERHVYLDEPVKIGRSVARCRPAQNNATFDCKVLSRNHALVWFDHKTGKYSLTSQTPRSETASPECELGSGLNRFSLFKGAIASSMLESKHKTLRRVLLSTYPTLNLEG
uniref:FHA domain-containing protein n=1 Tax=Cyclopterus lumpus TaxID=8103 RepID=A0A8C2WGS6_CYCLU